MDLNETPIKPGELTELTELEGGRRGRVFLLKNSIGQQLVIKFQKESTSSPVAATHILQKARAMTAKAEKAEPADLDAISNGIKESAKLKFLEREWNGARADRSMPHALLMDFVEGQTIKSMLSQEWREVLEVITDETFQVQLGRILAADVFAGNNDRMFGAYRSMTAQQPTGWYNEGNLFIAKDKTGKSPKPVAIDNAFEPMQVMEIWDKFPWGAKMGFMSFGSLAPANEKLAWQEAGLLFEAFLEAAKESNSGLQPEITNLESTKTTFQRNVSFGAKQAISELLARGQGWKEQISLQGIDYKVMGAFRIRKRVLRQVSQGIEDVAKAIATANDVNQYRKWVLTHEYKVAELDMEPLLATEDSYKKFKRGKINS